MKMTWSRERQGGGGGGKVAQGELRLAVAQHKRKGNTTASKTLRARQVSDEGTAHNMINNK